MKDSASTLVSIFEKFRDHFSGPIVDKKSDTVILLFMGNISYGTSYVVVIFQL